MRTLSLVLIAFLLSGCFGFGTGKPAVLPPPASLTEPCPLPADLPPRALNDREVEIYWGRDRSSLRSCASRHDGLSSWAAEATK